MGETAKQKISFNFSDFRRVFFPFVGCLMVIIIVKNNITESQLYASLEKICNMFKYVLTFGILEFLLKNVFNLPDLTYGFTELFFGVSELSTVTEPTMRGNLYLVQGPTKEASHFVISLFTMSLFYISLCAVKARSSHKSFITSLCKSPLLLCVFLMFGTSGMSAFWYTTMIVAFIFVLWYKFTKLNKDDVFKSIIFITILTVSISIFAINIFNDDLFYLFERFDRITSSLEILTQNPAIFFTLTIDTDTDISTVIRLFSIYEVGSNVFDRPFGGLGPGVQYAHDTFVTTLCDFGVMGLMIWIKLIRANIVFQRKYDFSMLVIILVAGVPLGVPHSIMIQFYPILLLECTALYCDEGLKEDNNAKKLSIDINNYSSL
ncbi:hypothetical protein [Selenomonas ruminantium]|uniref:hypothetical protein n=1 Tax=Selenomonas ruminantium TaxID=971 RepID=UPI0026EDB8FC|nr:hypothetical protein [Selenomonas ruminantium]